MTAVEVTRIEQQPHLAAESYGAGSLVVFLHSIGGNRRNWHPQMQEFSQHFQYVVYDASGCGDSDDYDGALTFSTYADDLCRLLDYFQAEKAHIVRLFMGSRVAMDGLRSPLLWQAAVPDAVRYSSRHVGSRSGTAAAISRASSKAAVEWSRASRHCCQRRTHSGRPEYPFRRLRRTCRQPEQAPRTELSQLYGSIDPSRCGYRPRQHNGIDPRRRWRGRPSHPACQGADDRVLDRRLGNDRDPGCRTPAEP
jgi:pimeloyl-ACP methyl ester carboxylesterase